MEHKYIDEAALKVAVEDWFGDLPPVIKDLNYIIDEMPAAEMETVRHDLIEQVKNNDCVYMGADGDYCGGMIDISRVYKYQDKQGKIGDGRDYFKVQRFPPTKKELLEMEKEMCEQYGFAALFIVNIIPLAQEDER